MNDRGSANLISVLIGLGITAIIALVMASQIVGINQFLKAMEHRQALAAAKNKILKHISCEKTVETTNLPSCDGSMVRLLDNSNNVLVGATNPDAVKIGNWTLRARCLAANKEIVIEAARLKPGGTIQSINISDFEKDPLTAQLADWGNASNAIAPIGRGICHAQLLSGGSTIFLASGISYPASSGFSHPSCDGPDVSRSATCPVGTKVVGGGVRCFGTTGAVELNSSRPNPATNSWAARCCDANDIEVQAVCLDVQ